MTATLLRRRWAQKALGAVLVLALLAPVFGWAAGAVGYAEPIDVAAEMTGAAQHAGDGAHGLFPGYSVPALGGAAGTFVSALLGIGLTLAVALGAGRLLEE
ncbi:MAG: metal transporter [Haloferacaceae archaeon]